MSEFKRLDFRLYHAALMNFARIALMQLNTDAQNRITINMLLDKGCFDEFELRLIREENCVQLWSRRGFRVKIRVPESFMSEKVDTQFFVETAGYAAFDFSYYSLNVASWVPIPGEVQELIGPEGFEESIVQLWGEFQTKALLFCQRCLMGIPNLQYGDFNIFFTALLPPVIEYLGGDNFTFTFTDDHMSVILTRNRVFGFYKACITFFAHSWLENDDRVFEITCDRYDVLKVEQLEGPPFNA